MIIVGGSQNTRTTTPVYGWEDNGVFFLSYFSGVKNGRRPMNRYDTMEELNQAVKDRNLKLIWQGPQ